MIHILQIRMRIGPSVKANVALLMIKTFHAVVVWLSLPCGSFFHLNTHANLTKHVDYWVVCSDSLLPLWCFFFYDAIGPGQTKRRR